MVDLGSRRLARLEAPAGETQSRESQEPWEPCRGVTKKATEHYTEGTPRTESFILLPPSPWTGRKRAERRTGSLTQSGEKRVVIL